MSQAVTCFGVHRDFDDVAWLVQGDGTSNSIGLKAPAPFDMSLPHGNRVEARCNHLIDLNTPDPPPNVWKDVKSIFHDPLFQAMLPYPRRHQEVFFVSEEAKEVLLDLSRLTSPLRSIITPMWMLDGSPRLYESLTRSNIQPYVLTNVGILDMAMLRQIAPSQPQLQRQLVIASPLPEMIVPAGVKKIKTKIKPKPNWPWEQIGTSLVRRYMRGEQL